MRGRNGWGYSEGLMSGTVISEEVMGEEEMDEEDKARKIKRGRDDLCRADG